MSTSGLDLAIVEQWFAELQLLKHSLLPDEYIHFHIPSEDASLWEDALSDTSGDHLSKLASCASTILHFSIGISGFSDIWFDVGLTLDAKQEAEVLSKGDTMGRDEQLRWQNVISTMNEEVRAPDGDFSLFQLFSEHLLPRLHDEATSALSRAAKSGPGTANIASASESRQRYHALLTSHHLVSPMKRRNMQHWAGQLRLSGFAKVGYPGVIYCEGDREAVDEFVGNVKAMQWLALRVRFVEEVPDAETRVEGAERERGQWTEFEKVGDVVEEMRRLGRESFVVEMGIGSAGSAR